jgi:cell division protein FtsB
VLALDVLPTLKALVLVLASLLALTVYALVLVHRERNRWVDRAAGYKKQAGEATATIHALQGRIDDLDKENDYLKDVADKLANEVRSRGGLVAHPVAQPDENLTVTDFVIREEP